MNLMKKKFRKLCVKILRLFWPMWKKYIEPLKIQLFSPRDLGGIMIYTFAKKKHEKKKKTRRTICFQTILFFDGNVNISTNQVFFEQYPHTFREYVIKHLGYIRARKILQIQVFALLSSIFKILDKSVNYITVVISISTILIQGGFRNLSSFYMPFLPGAIYWIIIKFILTTVLRRVLISRFII